MKPPWAAGAASSRARDGCLIYWAVSAGGLRAQLGGEHRHDGGNLNRNGDHAVSDDPRKTRSEPCPAFPAGPHVLSDPRFAEARARGEKRRSLENDRDCPDCLRAQLEHHQLPLDSHPGHHLRPLVVQCPECRRLRLDAPRLLERAQWLLGHSRSLRQQADRLLDDLEHLRADPQRALLDD